MDEPVQRIVNGELIRVQDANNEEGQAASSSMYESNNLTPGLLESCLSPDLPDRKRYAIKEKVSLGVYKPSFSMQPENISKTAAAANIVNLRDRTSSTNLNDKSIDCIGEQSPKLSDNAAVGGGYYHNRISRADDQELLGSSNDNT